MRAKAVLCPFQLFSFFLKRSSIKFICMAKQFHDISQRDMITGVLLAVVIRRRVCHC
jgi:DNA-binding transcriptional regulator YiaG